MKTASEKEAGGGSGGHKRQMRPVRIGLALAPEALRRVRPQQFSAPAGGEGL